MTKRQHTIKQHGIVSDRDPAFSGRDCLRSLQAKAADVTPRSHGTIAIESAMGVRTILNQSEVVATRNFYKAIHRRGVSPQVHNADGARARRDTALHVIGIGEQGFRIDIAENRVASALQDWSGGGKESVTRHDELCARLDSQRKVRAVKRRGPAV